MPENRLAADLDHRLRPNLSLFGHAGADSAGEDYDLHGVASRTAVRVSVGSLNLTGSVADKLSATGGSSPGSSSESVVTSALSIGLRCSALRSITPLGTNLGRILKR